MTYVATIPVEFPCPVGEVYREVCDLSRHPLWNSGMRNISSKGPMYEGMTYRTEVVAAAHAIHSEVHVVRLVPNREIELVNDAGLVTFHAVFSFHELGPARCQVVCHMQFKLQNFVLNLARQAIESMAQAKLRADLETLRAIITGTN